MTKNTSKLKKQDKIVWYGFLVMVGICAFIGIYYMLNTIAQAYQGCSFAEGSCPNLGTLTLNGTVCSYTTTELCLYAIPSNCFAWDNKTLTCRVGN